MCLVSLCLFHHFADSLDGNFCLFIWPNLKVPDNVMSQAAYSKQGTAMHANETDCQGSSQHWSGPEQMAANTVKEV